MAASGAPVRARVRRRPSRRAATRARAEAGSRAPVDVVVVGGGIGGLTCAAVLAHYGRRVVVCESHYAPGGAAHGFARDTQRGTFRFDTGPSFFAGLGEPAGLNPLGAVLDLVGEPLQLVRYEPIGTFWLEQDKAPLKRFSDFKRLVPEVARFSAEGAAQLEAAIPGLRGMHGALLKLPVAALRADWRVAPVVALRYLAGLAELGQYAPLLPNPTLKLLDAYGLKDPWLRRLADLECFLLSGVDASGTVAAEFASVFGESDALGFADFPLGGGEAIAAALVRAIEKRGGEVRLRAHVEEVVVEGGRAAGVRLRGGDVVRAPVVVSNASVWDTYGSLIPRDAVPPSEAAEAVRTPTTPSMMHLHLGIDAAGLDLSGLGGHHVVVHDVNESVETPGNVCMISIASHWDPSLAPEGCHCIHAYTLEEYDGWSKADRAAYDAKKAEKIEPLWRALERVIPDVRERAVVELTASPLSHAHWLRRHRGTYGAEIRAPKSFPAPATGVQGLYRAGDSVAPGVGVPAAAGSGLIVANTIAGLGEHLALLDELDARKAPSPA